MELQGDGKNCSRLVMLLTLSPEDAGKSKKMELQKIGLCAISRQCFEGFLQEPLLFGWYWYIHHFPIFSLAVIWPLPRRPLTLGHR